MKSFKTVLSGCGVCLLALILFMPFIPFNQATPHEVWFLQAIQAMRQGFHLIPRLNGLELAGQNPIQIMLLALLPDALLLARLVMVVFGMLVVGAVYAYADTLWGRAAGFWSALFTASSLGAVQGFGLLNIAAVPCAFVLWAYLIFTLTYLKGYNRAWYLAAYLCLLPAVLCGGIFPLLLFACAVILLILLDVSPQRFREIKPVFGLVVILGILIVFYLVYRIVGGSAYVSSILWPGGHLGLFKGLALCIYATLPWLPLIIPAWIFTARPDEWDDWRELLPAKIGVLLVVIVLLFSGKSMSGYALLAAPFSSLLIGYWVGQGSRIPPQAESVRRISFMCVGLALLALPIVYLARHYETVFMMSLPQAALLVLAFVIVIAMLILVKTRRFVPALIASLLAVTTLAWHAPLATMQQVPDSGFITSLAQYRPLLVFKDDLVMRGYIAEAGQQPLVVGREFVPVGSEAYLAVATAKLKGLLKDLQGRMYVTPVRKLKRSETYALIRVVPWKENRPPIPAKP